MSLDGVLAKLWIIPAVPRCHREPLLDGDGVIILRLARNLARKGKRVADHHAVTEQLERRPQLVGDLGVSLLGQ